MPTYDCVYCGQAFRNNAELTRHVVYALHPQQPQKYTCPGCGKGFNDIRMGTHHAATCGKRPLLMGPPPTRAWVCQECNFQTENQTESILHDELHAAPAPTMREVETAAAKLVKMEAELAAAEVQESDPMGGRGGE
jgi:transposase-like protein